ncbi:MAG: Fic family protein [Clostridioides sp.]|jgi:Fic family protein|nr:Fic family protein [Clostridioides sp.]
MNPFVPKKLPFDDLNLLYFMNELIEANKNIARYQEILNSSKISWDILINPLLLQEAVQSTKIEGTQVTIDEVLESELENNKEKDDNVTEVLNYYKALVFGEDSLKRLPLGTRIFKKLHEILMSDNVRGKNKSPGEFRRIQNFIGPTGCTVKTATFVPPEPQLVDDYISNLEKYMNDRDDAIDPLIKIAIIHAQFETIHPFLDGNGRIGRILIPLYLYDVSLIDAPNFFISDTLEKDKFRYYKMLNDTRLNNKWNEWIKFFIESINEQAKKNINVLKIINNNYEESIETARKLVKNNKIIDIVEMMYRVPIFNVNKMAELTGIQSQTCRKYLNVLESNNVIFSDGKSRGKTYYNYTLLENLR